MPSKVTIRIRRAFGRDAALLTQISRETFKEAFARDLHEKDLYRYMDENYQESIQKSEIRKPDAIVLLVVAEDTPVGFSMVYPAPPPPCLPGDRAIQLKRFYLFRKYHGTGAANELMCKTLAETATSGYENVWLSCWELNERALSFYRRWQFTDAGRQFFTVGTDVQQDVILTRPAIL